ncbi:MAG: hypothetical protein KC503_23805 [Myxococcales bacterium]|nr:hypothetical protein [Myxococcales bacterium]
MRHWSLLLSVLVLALAACGSRTRAVGGDARASDARASDAPGADGPQPAGCTNNTQCASTHYCKLDGACGAQGRCEARPITCPSIAAPVCGCDGKTHGNACTAAGAGVSVRRDGRCEVAGCDAVKCGVLDDCCTCSALDFLNSKAPPPCPAPCFQTVCAARGIKPTAYCLAGKCLLADSKPCRGDDDCFAIDDCCTCMAWPRDLKPPLCDLTCAQSSCSALGLSGAKPACIEGSCRLSLP